MAKFVKPLCPACGKPTAEDCREGWQHKCPVTLEPPNWTCRDGRSNTSSDYNELVEMVAQLIGGSSWSLFNGPPGHRQVAALIISQLAFKYNVGPLDAVPPQYWPTQEVTRDPEARPDALTGQD